MDIISEVTSYLTSLDAAGALEDEQEPERPEGHEWILTGEEGGREQYECSHCGQQVSMRAGGAGVVFPFLMNEQCGGE